MPTINEALQEAFESNAGTMDQLAMFYFLRGVLWGHCAAHGLSVFDNEDAAITYIRQLITPQEEHHAIKGRATN